MEVMIKALGPTDYNSQHARYIVNLVKNQQCICTCHDTGLGCLCPCEEVEDNEGSTSEDVSEGKS